MLATTPSQVPDTDLYVFPQIAALEPDSIFDDALDELIWLDENEREQAVSDVGYLSWRAGITASGEWRFFVRGD